MTTIEVPVKPYIKEYLEQNFGNPVNFSGVRGVKDFFSLLLEKQTYRFDKRITLTQYKSSVQVVITRDDFYRHGWGMSATAIVSFNSMFEYIVKTRARDVITIKCRDAKIKVAPAIRQMQIEFEFTEENFSFDAIKKDLQRHTKVFRGSKKQLKTFGTDVPKKQAV